MRWIIIISLLTLIGCSISNQYKRLRVTNISDDLSSYQLPDTSEWLKTQFYNNDKKSIITYKYLNDSIDATVINFGDSSVLYTIK